MTVNIAKSRPVLFPPDHNDPIVEHALDYASRGWPVLVLDPDTKVSLKSAKNSPTGLRWGQTTDPEEIRRDFKRWPNANVGIATGDEAGFFVVETDTADGHGEGTDGAAELAKLEAEYGALPATLEAESPSGSVHRYYLHHGFPIKNSASAVAPGVDVRGDGGMVVAPPSVKPGKGAYKWRNNLPIVPCPQWLLDRILAGKEKPEPEPTISQQAMATVPPRDGFDDDQVQRRARNGTSYIEAALSGEYDALARASKGSRNTDLNNAAVKLGHYVGSGLLDESVVVQTLLDACASNGSLAEDGRPQCLATIKSGLAKGKTEPKGVPERTAEVYQFPGTSPLNPNPAQSLAIPLTYFNEVAKTSTKHFIIKDILAKNEISRVIAAPGKGKSTFAIDLAISVASGTDWRGYKSKHKCGVVYFALERGDLVKRRLHGHQLRDGLGDLPIAVASRIINLMHPGCVDIIVATIHEAEKTMGCPIGLIVLDVYPKGIAAGGGDENLAKDQGIALANLRRVQEIVDGLHIMNIGHTGKDETKGARGSNSQGGDDDVVIQISGDGAIKSAKIIKINDGEERTITQFKMEVSEIGTDEDGDLITAAIVSRDDCGFGAGVQPAVKAKLTDTERRAMDLLYKAINEDGKPGPPSNRFPQKISVVPVDTWRAYCERGGLSKGDSESAFRTAFHRVSISLTNKRRIDILDALVWVART